jgi:hypothetical protein
MFRGKEDGNQNQFSIEKKMREESPSSFWVIDFKLQPPPPLQYSEWKRVRRKEERRDLIRHRNEDQRLRGMTTKKSR